MAIYRFARTADDLADEGDAGADDRLRALATYRDQLDRSLMRRLPPEHWPEVFVPLAHAHQRHDLPLPLLHDLLSAFEQDARNPTYADRAALLDYCRRSANPVGRLLLHLYGISDAASCRRSDAVCTALQLINFWQDLGQDQRRGRDYLPQQDRVRHALPPHGVPLQPTPALRSLVRELCGWARELMLEGAPLALQVPGRAGWELRLVIQGGLRILQKIERLDHDTLQHRPTVAAPDLPLLLGRACAMGWGHA